MIKAKLIKFDEDVGKYIEAPVINEAETYMVHEELPLFLLDDKMQIAEAGSYFIEGNDLMVSGHTEFEHGFSEVSLSIIREKSGFNAYRLILEEQ